jgi:hypothetical protein
MNEFEFCKEQQHHRQQEMIIIIMLFKLLHFQAGLSDYLHFSLSRIHLAAMRAWSRVGAQAISKIGRGLVPYFALLPLDLLYEHHRFRSAAISRYSKTSLRITHK